MLDLQLKPVHVYIKPIEMLVTALVVLVSQACVSSHSHQLFTNDKGLNSHQQT